MDLKIFDEKITELYSQIISACLEYSGEEEVDCVYVIGTNTRNIAQSGNFFYKVDEKFFINLELDEYLQKNIDTSGERVSLAFDNILSAFDKIYKLFMEVQGESPTEIKLKYDVKTGKFGSQISYDKRMENSTTLTTGDLLDEWCEEAKAGKDGFDF